MTLWIPKGLASPYSYSFACGPSVVSNDGHRIVRVLNASRVSSGTWARPHRRHLGSHCVAYPWAQACNASTWSWHRR